VAQKRENKQERPLQSFHLKDFLAVDTTDSRIAGPPQAFYNLQNAQPVGGANIHSINDWTTVLHNYSTDAIYYDTSVNIAGTDYLIQASTTGKLFAYNVSTQTATQINGAFTLSGAGTWIVQWSNTNAMIIDASGYFTWNGSGNITAVSGTGAPANGNAIAVYQNRVWIAQGRLLSWSAPASFSDFTTANGGGSISLIDSTLRSSVQALFAANGYLYIFGTSSIDSISDLYVPTGASPPTPNFTKLNLSAIVGTDQPYSIFVYGRLVLFANKYGAWSLYGTTITSISAPDPNNTYKSSINGTWQYLNQATVISGGQVVTNGLLCAAFLINRANDPIFGSGPVIAMYQGDAAGGKWWFASWPNLTRVVTSFVGNIPALFAYASGSQLVQLFAVTTAAPPAIVTTEMWDFDDPITEKQAIKAGVNMIVQQAGSGGISLTLDTLEGSTPIFTSSAIVQWVNSNGGIVQWQNNAFSTVLWAQTQPLTYWGQAPRGFAKYIGLTLSTSQGTIFELDAFLLDYKFAARWVGN
jgi:hypothetical protein